jgi:chaperonin GroES
VTDQSAGIDPFNQPGRGGPSQLTDVRPQGNQVIIGDDGQATVVPPTAMPGPMAAGHFDNLAIHLDPTRLNEIATDLLEAIEMDKESREDRDKQYEEGLNRTGMGSNTIGGAQFPGASRAVHPLLLEAAIDFGGGVMLEMLPPDGPVKSAIVGDENDAKNDRAKRVSRYMNWQLTEQMTSAYHEFEVGFTQCPIGGAFYTKGYEDNGTPAVSFVPIDLVYRPWNDGDFYSQPRITHAQNIDKWTYRSNVSKGLWIAAIDISAETGSQIPDETDSEQANDRIIGRKTPSQNLDGIRLVYETSVMMSLLDDDEGPLEPYLVTIDEEARKVLSIYRNWREDDNSKQRLVFLIEWPFWPWRGGYPVGMTHMIGSLSGAATGTLRALLDAGMLNTTQTGVRLKGGATAGGQTLKPSVTEITEIQGSLAQDDIRKTFMPFKFNEPSPVLFQLLGFLVEAGRGVVRTTFDEYDKINGQTPVGTAQMFIEQGLKNFGAVHGRLHRSMRLFLKWLYQLNGDTLTPQTIIDQHGELTVNPADFQGPMVVIPVSDPRIFSDLQRKAMAQTIAQRAQMMHQAQIPIYNVRATEANFLRQYGVTNPDQFLVPNPIPKQMNAVAENVAASTGGPVKAFPGQDHEAHIHMHKDYLSNPIFGSNPAVAEKLIPIMINHIGEHVSLWYSDAMLEAATQALRTQTNNPDITLDSFMAQGTEVPLDRMMDQLDDHVFELAAKQMKEVPGIIMQAKDLLKKLAPPVPMDPSMVAQDDVQRQREKDKSDSQAKIIDIRSRMDKTRQDAALKAHQTNTNAEIEKRQQDIDERREQLRLLLEAQKQQQDAQKAEEDRVSRETIAENRDNTQLIIAGDRTQSTENVAYAGHDNQQAIAEAGHESAEKIAEDRNESAEQVAKMRPKPTAGGGE